MPPRRSKKRTYSASGKVNATTSKPLPKSVKANTNPTPQYTTVPTFNDPVKAPKMPKKKKQLTWDEHLNKVLKADVKSKPKQYSPTGKQQVTNTEQKKGLVYDKDKFAAKLPKFNQKGGSPKSLSKKGGGKKGYVKKPEKKEETKLRNPLEIQNDLYKNKMAYDKSEKPNPFRPKAPKLITKSGERIKPDKKILKDDRYTEESKKQYLKDIKKINKKIDKEVDKANAENFNDTLNEWFKPGSAMRRAELDKLEYRAKLLAAKKDLKNEYEVSKMRESIKGESAKDRQEREKRIRADELAQYQNALTGGGKKHTTKKQTKKDLAKQAIYEYNNQKGITGFGDAMGFQTKDQTIKSRTGYDISKEVAKAKESLKYQGGYMGGIGVSFIGPGMAEGAVATGIKGGVRGAKALATGKKIVGTGDNAIRLAKGAKGVKNATGTIPQQFNRPLLNKIAQGKAPKLTERAGTKIAGELARGGNERLAKQLLKKRLGENAKDFAARRAADVVVSTPLNINEAQKMGRDENGKLTASGFAKSFAFNTAMDMAFGTLFQGIGSGVGKMNAKKAIVEVIENGGENLSEKTLTQLKKLNMKPDDVLAKAKNVEELAQRYAKEAPAKTPQSTRPVKSKGTTNKLETGGTSAKKPKESIDDFLGDGKTHPKKPDPRKYMSTRLKSIEINKTDKTTLEIKDKLDVDDMKGAWETAQEKAREIADKQSAKTELGMRNKEVVDYLRNTPIKVSDLDKANITDFKTFKGNVSRKLKFADDGADIDSVYMELNELYPEHFPDNITNTHDQLLHMADVAERLREPLPVEDGVIDDIANSLIDNAKEYEHGDIKATTRAEHEAHMENVKLGKAIDGYIVDRPAKEVLKDNQGAIGTLQSKEKVKLKGEGNKIARALQEEFTNEQAGLEAFSKKHGKEEIIHEIQKVRNAPKAANDVAFGKQRDFYGKEIGGGINDIMKPLYAKGQKYVDAMNDYLYYNLNKDRALHDKGILKATPGESRRVVKLLLKNHPDLKKDAEPIYEFFDNLRKYQIDAGLLDEETSDLLRMMYADYVPALRDMETPKELVRGSMGITGIKSAKGGYEKILPIESQMYLATQSIYKNAHANKLFNTIADTIGEAKPKDVLDTMNFADISPKAYVKNGKRFLDGMKDGKSFSIEVDGDVYKSFETLHGTQEKRAWEMVADLKALGGINKLFKAGITTLSPPFMIRNFVKDQGEALLNSKQLGHYIANWPKALQSMAKRDEGWKLYVSQGGPMVTLFDMTKGLTKGKSKLSYLNPAKWIETANQAIEQFPRYTEFRATIDKAIADGEIAGWHEIDTKAGKKVLDRAMHNSADVTVNFSRGGRTTKALNRSFVPFLNPSIQGTSRMIRRFTDEGALKGSIGVAKLFGNLIVLGMSIPATLEFLQRNDPDYQALSRRTKDRYICFRNPLNPEVFVKIPKGRVYAIFAGAGQRVIAGETSKDDWKDWVAMALEQQGPANPIDNNLLSPWLKTDLFDPKSPGKRWYGADILSPEDMKKQPKEQYDSQTSWYAKKLGSITGKSPKKIDNLADSYLGIFSDVAHGATAPLTKANSPLDIGKSMLKKNFEANPIYDNKYQSEYYKKVDAVNEKAKSGKTKDVALSEYYKRNGWKIAPITETINKVKEKEMPKDIKGKAGKKVWAAKKMKQLDDLEKARNALYKNGNAGEKEFINFVKKNKGKYPDEESLYRAAQAQAEKVSSSTETFDTLVSVVGAKKALKLESEYIDEKKDKKKKQHNHLYGKVTPYEFAQKFVKNGGTWNSATEAYKTLQKQKNEGKAIDPRYNTLVAAMIHKGELSKVCKKAMDIKKEDIATAKAYFKGGGSLKELKKACSHIETTATLSEGKEKGKHYTSNYKAVALTRSGASIEAYNAVDPHKHNIWGGDKKSGTLKMANTGKGVVKEGFSDNYLGKLDDKIGEDEHGFNKPKSIKKVIDSAAKKKGYNREKKALLYDFFSSGYGDNPYGMVANYLDPKDKKVVTASTDSGGGKGKGGGHGSGRGRGGRTSGSGSSTQSWESFLKENGIKASSVTPLTKVDWKIKKSQAASKLKKFNPKASQQQKQLIKMLLKTTRK